MRYFFALIAALILWAAPGTAEAQVGANLNFNLDSQPVWGPTGYDYVEYYYLPDIDVYYSVPRHQYYYYTNGNLRYSSKLPSRYSNYDFYNSYKVVLNEHQPWRNSKSYREKYSSYKNRHDQQPIRDSKDSKYFVNKNHPEHNNWLKQQKHDNGKNKSPKQNDKKNNGRGKR